MGHGFSGGGGHAVRAAVHARPGAAPHRPPLRTHVRRGLRRALRRRVRRMPSPSHPPSDMTTLPEVDTNCTALSLMPTIIGNTFAASLRTDICPQRKEARPRLKLGIRLILTFLTRLNV